VINTVATAPARGAEVVIVRSMFPEASVFDVVVVSDAGVTFADA